MPFPVDAMAFDQKSVERIDSHDRAMLLNLLYLNNIFYICYCQIKLHMMSYRIHLELPLLLAFLSNHRLLSSCFAIKFFLDLLFHLIILGLSIFLIVLKHIMNMMHHHDHLIHRTNDIENCSLSH